MNKEHFLNFTNCTSAIVNRNENDIRLIGVGYQDMHVDKSDEYRRIQHYYTIHFVVSGKGYLEFRNKKYKLGPNDIFALPDKTPFKYYSDKNEPWAYAFFEFDGTLCQSYLKEAGFSLDKPVQTCLSPQKILLELSEFFQKMHDDGCVCYHEVVSVFSLILASLSRKTKRTPMLQEDTFISNIKNFIKLRFLDPNFSIDFLTREFFISHSYLCKIFKEKTGTTLISYINEQKMRNAEKLLRTTNFSVYEIAYMSGFNSYPHFLTIFKKLHNITATEYRKSIKQ